MKMRYLAFAPLMMLTTAGAGVMTGGCSSGGGGATTGSGGTSGGNTPVLTMANLLSDFEDATAATIVQAGTPTRNGYWYSYNDMAATCVQMPANGAAYVGSAPTTPPGASPGPSPTMGGNALHAVWTGCSTWGAGVGADLNQPQLEAGTYSGPKVPYDLTAYQGITFWAASSPTGDNKLRVKLPMTDETKIADGGNCNEADPTIGMNKCSDDWGQVFSLPTNGSWTQIIVKFSDSTKFKQEGWGHTFPWNPAHVTSIQVQSQGSEMGQSFDFWLDDFYLY
jgi:hypothetical protein